MNIKQKSESVRQYTGQDYEKYKLVLKILKKSKELTDKGYGHVKFVWR